MKRPPVGLCLPCRVVNVRDGDTVVVTCLTGANWAIRLVGCNCDELYARDPEQRSRACAAKEFVENRLRLSDRPHVWIPLSDEAMSASAQDGGGVNLLKLATFDRVPGEIYLDEHTTLSETLILAGLGTAAKCHT